MSFRIATGRLRRLRHSVAQSPEYVGRRCDLDRELSSPREVLQVVSHDGVGVTVERRLEDDFVVRVG